MKLEPETADDAFMALEISPDLTVTQHFETVRENPYKDSKNVLGQLKLVGGGNAALVVSSDFSKVHDPEGKMTKSPPAFTLMEDGQLRVIWKTDGTEKSEDDVFLSLVAKEEAEQKIAEVKKVRAYINAQSPKIAAALNGKKFALIQSKYKSINAKGEEFENITPQLLRNSRPLVRSYSSPSFLNLSDLLFLCQLNTWRISWEDLYF